VQEKQEPAVGYVRYPAGKIPEDVDDEVVQVLERQGPRRQGQRNQGLTGTPHRVLVGSAGEHPRQKIRHAILYVVTLGSTENLLAHGRARSALPAIRALNETGDTFKSLGQ
jgi:hypothetical protein